MKYLWGMPRLSFYFFLSVTVVLFTTCRNDLELNAPYKEIPSIYAVLNPSEPVHVIRINKVFLGEGDANEMAKVADSVNYPAGELTVTLRRFVNDQQTNEISFTEEERILGEGDFSRTQRVYVSTAALEASGEYRLEVKNNKTGNVFTARTTAFGPIRGSFPPLVPPVYPYPPTTDPSLYIDYSQNGGTVRFSPNEAKVYQLVIRTHFYDSLNENPVNNKRFDYVDFTFTTQEERNKQVVGQTAFLVSTFRSVDYFTAAGLELRKKNLPENVRGRRIERIEYLVHSSTQDYIDYLQYTSPSFAITQNTPIYSNFDNKAAIGIFTWRTTFSISKHPATLMHNEFARNPNTCDYRFFDASLQVGNCIP